MVRQFSKSRIVQCVAIAAAFAVFALIFISYLMGPLWHAYHGNSVTIGDWRLQIPKRYSGFGHNSYFTFSLGAPFFNKSYGQISVFTHDVSTGLSQERIETAVVLAAESDGYILKDRNTIQTGVGPNYCFQFTERLHPSRVAVRCVSSSGELSIFFEGDQRFSGTVYDVARGTSRIRP